MLSNTTGRTLATSADSDEGTEGSEMTSNFLSEHKPFRPSRTYEAMAGYFGHGDIFSDYKA